MPSHLVETFVADGRSPSLQAHSQTQLLLIGMQALFVGGISAIYSATLLFARWGVHPSADSNYHFSVARDYAAGRFPDESQNLPYSIFSDMNVDHYFGYHALLAPFALLDDPILGMKLSTIAFFSAVPLSLWAFLRSLKVRGAWAWAFVPVLLANQDWRYLMLRGGHLVAPLSLLFLHVAFFAKKAKHRRTGVLIISTFGMLCYQGSLVLLPLHLGCLFALLLFGEKDAFKARRLDPLLTAVGFGLALCCSPFMDRSAATFRFLWYHVAYMNADPARLYPGLREFGPVPLSLLVHNPIFWVFPLACLGAAALLVRRHLCGQRMEYRQIVLLGALLTGLILTARAIRLREYSVPWAICFLSVLPYSALFRSALPHSVLPHSALPQSALPQSALPNVIAPGGLLARFMPAFVALLVPLALLIQWPNTYVLIGHHLPTLQYRGARPLLEEFGRRPVLNIAEGDYTTLRFEYPQVVAVQGLSHYFLYPNRSIFEDVMALRSGSSDQAVQALRRFYDRGVRLVSVQHRGKFFRFAESHPELLRPRYRARYQGLELEGSTIYEIDPSAWRRQMLPLSRRPLIRFSGTF